jgi:putative endonuclease
MKGVFGNNYCTYITSNPSRTVFYTGVTNNLGRRLQEHYENRGNAKTFAGRYYCYQLVYYEQYFYMREAIAREKEIKDLKRADKLILIKSINPSLLTLVITE